MTTLTRSDRRDSAGDTFKAAERALRTTLTPGLPAIIRLDGRAFHSYCRGLERPYDVQFMDDMDQTAATLAQQVDGVRLAYVQSDEISLLLTDHVGDAVQGFMFGGQTQKLVSICAAIAATTMNIRRLGAATDKVALFDARAFSLPDDAAVQRYFQWRQQDAATNSLSMLASAHISHKQLLGVPTGERARLLRGLGVEPGDLPAGFTRGRVIQRAPVQKQTTFTDRRSGTQRTVEFVRMETFSAPAPSFADGVEDALF